MEVAADGAPTRASHVCRHRGRTATTTFLTQDDCRPRSRCTSPARRWRGRSVARSAATAATSPRPTGTSPRRRARPGRSGRVRHGGRELRVLQAADEQPGVRVGRGHLVPLRAPRQPDAGDGRGGAGPPDPAHPALRRGQQRQRQLRPPRRRHRPERTVSAGRGSGPRPTRIAILRTRPSSRRAPWARVLASAPTTYPGAAGNVLNLDYECDYNSLHLPSRDDAARHDHHPGRLGVGRVGRLRMWALILPAVDARHGAARRSRSVPAGQLAMAGAARQHRRGHAREHAGMTAVAGHLPRARATSRASRPQVHDRRARQRRRAVAD